MEKYIVAIAENDFKREGFSNELAIVSANNKEDAIHNFIINYINTTDDCNFEILNTESFISGLFDHAREQQRYSEEETIQIIKDRIVEFFKGTNYAEIFIQEYFISEELREDLPIDLMAYFILKDNYLGEILVSNIKDMDISNEA